MQHNRLLADVGADSGTPRDEIPEDVRAELDEPLSAVQQPVEPLPEDVLSEQDLEVRRAEEELRQQQVEGRPPEEEEPRS